MRNPPSQELPPPCPVSSPTRPGLPVRGGCLRRAGLLLTGMTLALAGPWAQAQVRVTPHQIGVRTGHTRTFTAARADGSPGHWLWSLEGAPPGAVINPATGAFHAPEHLAAPTAFKVRVADTDVPGATGQATVVVTEAPIVVFNLPTAEQDNTSFPLHAERTDELASTLAWTVHGPGGKIVQVFDKPWFQPPRVTEPTPIELRVQDTAHPRDTVAVQVTVVPSLVSLRFGEEPSLPLAPGQACLLEATRVSGPVGPWTWKVLELNGGDLQEVAGGVAGQPARARYTAPQVAVPTTFHVKVMQSPHYAATLAIPVRPTLKVTASSSHVLSGGVCLLRVADPRPVAPDVPPPHRWHWQVIDPEGPADWLRQRPDPDEIAFTAPRVGWPTPFTLEVRADHAPEAPTRIKLLVLPPLGALQPGTEAVFERLLPNVLGDDWLAPMPQATLLAGRLGLTPNSGPGPFRGINCLCFVERDPAMAALGGNWLVGDREGIKTVTPMVTVTPHATWLGNVTALAPRPRGSSPGDPFRLAFATATGGVQAQGMVNLLNLQTGETRTLAGTSGRWPAVASLEVGPGPQTAFGRIESLVWTDGGALDVVDGVGRTRRIRRIAPDGQVTLLFKKHLPALRWDPPLGMVYAATGHGLAQVALDGTVQPLTSGAHPGFQDGVVGLPPEPLLTQAQGLQRLGPYLFFADPDNQAIRVFNLETKCLQTLAGNPTEKRPRLGPLGFGQGPAAAYAALAEPRVFAVNAAGDCVVAQDEGLVHLDLSILAQALPKPEEAARDEAAAASSSSAAPAASMPSPGHPGRKRPSTGPPETQRTPPQPKPSD